MMPTAMEFRVTLRARMQGAEHASKTTVEINSGQLHREVGGYPGQNHRMPMCCAVMRSEMSAGMRSYRSLRRSRALRSRSATSFPVADGDDHAERPRCQGMVCWLVAASTPDKAPPRRSAPPNTQAGPDDARCRANPRDRRIGDVYLFTIGHVALTLTSWWAFPRGLTHNVIGNHVVLG